MKTLFALLLLASSAMAQDYRIPERVWNPVYIPSPSYRIPERVWNPVYLPSRSVQTPGPWYTVDPANDWMRANPLPQGPIGSEYVWNGYRWVLVGRRCYCW